VERKDSIKRNKIGHLEIKKYKFERVENFKYLGVILNEDNSNEDNNNEDNNNEDNNNEDNNNEDNNNEDNNNEDNNNEDNNNEDNNNEDNNNEDNNNQTDLQERIKMLTKHILCYKHFLKINTYKRN